MPPEKCIAICKCIVLRSKYLTFLESFISRRMIEQRSEPKDGLALVNAIESPASESSFKSCNAILLLDRHIESLVDA